MKTKTLCICCKACGSTIYRYQKIGAGKVIVCWKKRILKDNSVKKSGEVYCRCGAQIGSDQTLRVKIRRNEVTIH